MIRYLCETMEEIDYILNKHKYFFSKSEYIRMVEYLEKNGHLVMFITNNKLYYCYPKSCLDCLSTIACEFRFSNTINTKILIREEKINRILYD